MTYGCLCSLLSSLPSPIVLEQITHCIKQRKDLQIGMTQTECTWKYLFVLSWNCTLNYHKSPHTTRWKAGLLSGSLSIYILSAVAFMFHQRIAWTRGREIIYSTLTGPTWVKSSCQVMQVLHGQCWRCQPKMSSHFSGCFCDTVVGIRSQLCWYISCDPSAPKFSHQSQREYYHLPHKRWGWTWVHLLKRIRNTSWDIVKRQIHANLFYTVSLLLYFVTSLVKWVRENWNSWHQLKVVVDRVYKFGSYTSLVQMGEERI